MTIIDDDDVGPASKTIALEQEPKEAAAASSMIAQEMTKEGAISISDPKEGNDNDDDENHYKDYHEYGWHGDDGDGDGNDSIPSETRSNQQQHKEEQQQQHPGDSILTLLHNTTTTTNRGDRHRRILERPVCCCCRRITEIPDRSPRCYSICAVIILPLWCLVLVSMIAGHFLAQMEAPLEVESNDKRLASRASLIFELNNTYRILNELPRFCYEAYLEDEQDQNITNLFLNNDTFEIEDVWDYFQEDLAEHMDNCTNATREIIDRIIAVTLRARSTTAQEKLAAASDPLTFDWIRCFNKTAIPRSRSWLQPSEEERDAVKQVNQTVFYTTTWEQQQQAYYDDYLEGNDNPTPEDNIKAFDYSITLATGDEDCDPNSQGTAWFWFTVMTTVGKL